MRKTALRLVPVIALLALVGCKPCTDLENRVCSDLGADCAVWKAHDKVGFPTGGSHAGGRSGARQRLFVALGLTEENGSACKALDNNYEPMIASIRTATAAFKRADSVMAALKPAQP